MRVMRGVSFGLIVLALAGCGDDGDGNGGGGSVTTGLPEDKVLGDVTADEAGELCDSLADSSASAFSAADLARAPCTIIALMTPSSYDGDQIDQAACQDNVEACLEDSPEPEPAAECDASGLMAALADCDATASELEACLNASVPEIRRLFGAINCNLDMDNPPAEFQEPAACEALNAKCPGALDAVSGVALPDIDFGGGTDSAESSSP